MKVEVAPEKRYQLSVRGHRLLIEPLSAKREGEIQLIELTEKADQSAQSFGKVLEVGPLCWKDLSYRKHINTYNDGITTYGGSAEGGLQVNLSQPYTVEESFGDQWCQAGDVILYQRYSGARVPDPVSGELRYDLVVINDKDVIAVVSKLDEYKEAYEEAKEEALAKERAEVEKRRANYGN